MEKGMWTGKTRLLAGGCAAALLLAGVFSGMGLRRLFPEDGKEVPVYSVEGLRNKKWSDAVALPATVETGALTAYYYDSRKPAAELYVKEGQMVEAGTPLLRYDCTVLEEELAGVERSLENQRVYLGRLGSFIEVLKTTKPRADGLGRAGGVLSVSARRGPAGGLLSVSGAAAPVSAEESLEGFTETEGRDGAPVVYDRVDEASVSSGGNGTAQDPYVYYVKKGGEVAPEMLAMLARMKLCGRFVVVEDETGIQTPLLVWTFDGKIYEEAIQGEAPSEPPAETTSSAPESSSESMEESSFTEDDSEAAETTGVPEPSASEEQTTEPEPSEESSFETEESPSDPEEETGTEGGGSFDDDALNEALEGLESEPQGYTKEELVRAIRERSLEYENLELAIRKNEQQAEDLKKEIEENVLTAKEDGQVRTAAEPGEAARLGQPVLTVQGRAGSLLRGQMNEVLAAALKPGDRFLVSARVRGKEVSFTAVLQSVETEPGDGREADESTAGGAQERAFGGDGAALPAGEAAGNPAMSHYYFSAFPEEKKGIREGDRVEIMIPRTAFGQKAEGEAASDGRIVLPDSLLSYEGGSAFVYAMGGNGRLEKRPVETGRSFGGTETEILSGLDGKDYLAVPEEAAGMEGARARIVYGEEMEIKTEESEGWEETEP